MCVGGGEGIWVFTVLFFQPFWIFENFQSKIWGRGKLSLFLFLSSYYLLKLPKKAFTTTVHQFLSKAPMTFTGIGQSPALLLDLLAAFNSFLLPIFSAPPSARFLGCNSIFMIHHWLLLLSLSLFESHLPNSYRVVSLGHFFYSYSYAEFFQSCGFKWYYYRWLPNIYL